MRPAGVNKSLDFVAEEQPTKQQQQKKQPKPPARKLEESCQRTGKPPRLMNSREGPAAFKSDDNISEFEEQPTSNPTTKQHRKPASSRPRPKAVKLAGSKECLSTRKSDENLKSKSHVSTKETAKKRSCRDRSGDGGHRRPSSFTGRFLCLSERAGKKLRSLGSKPINQVALSKTAEKVKKNMNTTPKKPTRAFIVGEDKPQRRPKQRARPNPASHSQGIAPGMPGVPMPMGSPGVPGELPAGGLPLSHSQQPTINVASMPISANTNMPRQRMMSMAKIEKPAQNAPESHYNANEVDVRNSKETFIASEYFDDPKTKCLPPPTNGDIMVDFEGRREPFWVTLPFEDPEEEEEIPYNGEAVLLVQNGSLKLAPMPSVSLYLEPSIDVKDLNKRDKLYFCKPVIFGNTMRSVIGVNDVNNEVDEAELQKKMMEGLEDKVVVHAPPNFVQIYQRDDLKKATYTTLFTPSPPSYGQLKPIVKTNS